MGLFNSAVLEVVIGIIFVYLLLGILCTAANELLAGFTRRRGKILKQGISQLLNNQPLKQGDPVNALILEFYKHPLITSIMHDTNHPAYISPRTFSTVLTDVLAKEKEVMSFEALEKGVEGLPDGQVRTAVLALLRRTQGLEPAQLTLIRRPKDLEPAQVAIETWFNDSMDRVSGWYKRRTQIWTIVIAAALTILANADTTEIARRLWTDPVLRSKVVEEAKVRAQKPRPEIMVEYEDEQDPTKPTVTSTESDEGNQLSETEREVLGQLMGWEGAVRDNSLKVWSSRILGWLLTILALTMGAPFWFDLLNKIMHVRFAGKSPDERPKEPEKPVAAAVRA